MKEVYEIINIAVCDADGRVVKNVRNYTPTVNSLELEALRDYFRIKENADHICFTYNHKTIKDEES